VVFIKDYAMKKFFLALSLASGAVMAQDVYVVSVQPRFSTVYQQQCQVVSVREDNSGVGTLIGAVAGGIIGNQVGGGSGRDIATVIGVGVGASVGNRIGQDQVNNGQRQVCQNVPVTVQNGETVTFSYRGRVFTHIFGN
jgi:uncharacterized protein YcfJ